METRTLGKTGLAVSVLGFGCGAVGGLMVKGTPADQEHAVARALEAGINYFDTAPLYGNGESERNLGRALKILRPDVVVGTKVRLAPAELSDVPRAIAASLEVSLSRLGREEVDLLQLHNPLAREGGGFDARAVLEEAVPALERLRAQGKIRFFGFSATGDTRASHRVIDAGVLYTAQVVYNLLNPSAGTAVGAGFPGQDYARLLDRTQRERVGAICIRVLAGGALSGDERRHPLGAANVAPIGTGADYRADVARTRSMQAIVREGHADSLVEASIRFAIFKTAIATVLVGYSTIEQLDYAIASAEKGPLPAAALSRIAELQAGFSGERG